MKLGILAAGIYLAAATGLQAQGGRGANAAPPPAKAAAPVDLTGYWVSMIVDEWRFRVTPQKGDIVYLPINATARRIALAWDPAKDEAEGNQCKAYGAVGVMQRPGRLHITWDDDNTLRIETDAGGQTRLVHFNATATPKADPTWQGYSIAQWQLPNMGRGRVAAPGTVPGNLKVVTNNMLPGYIRKNGVPYSGNAVLTEYVNRITGAENDSYMVVTAMVDDPAYLNQPFVRSYQFKKQPDSSGWSPTPCWPR
ncbi:MAG TPA: hypothetical protein VG096_18105 [Bryobacteraceae bacterium]|jgi:hypothetical protein|nr:hypothetical protein [Bryobacteraceae bacterium]